MIGRSLALGWKGGVLTVLGNASGQLIQVAAVALGLGIVVAQSSILFNLVKLAGAAYLIYLGIQAIRHRGNPLDAGDQQVRSRYWRLVGEGAIVGVTNPKSVIFFIAVLPQFVDYPSGAVPFQLGLLGAVFLLIAIISDSAWAIAAGTARHWFARSPERLPAVEATGGALMIGLGGTLALTGSKS